MKTIETYSRELELIKDLFDAWHLNRKDYDNQRVTSRMEAIKTKHNLNWEEYHYWCNEAGTEFRRIYGPKNVRVR